MLKMIIADDEKLIRDFLKNSLDWGLLGIEIVGCCKNGIETLDTIIDEAPDIVLTDIQMPGINGLDLIEKIVKLDSQIEFIILSGYKEFEFAKRAMQYGVHQYLLKPISEKDLISAVEKAKEDYIKKTALHNQVQVNKQLISLKRRQFVFDVFTKSQNQDELIKTYESILKSDALTYTINYFSFVEESLLFKFSKLFFRFIKNHKINLITELLYAKNTIIILTSDNTSLENDIHIFTEKFNYSQKTTSITYHCEYLDTLNLTIDTLISRISTHNKILYINENLNIEEIFKNILMVEEIKKIAQIIIKLPKDNKDDIYSIVDTFFQSESDISIVKNYSATLISYIIDNEINHTNIDGVFDKLYTFSEKKDLLDFLKESILKILFVQETEYTLITNKIIAYVENNLQNPNISLKWIAENHVYGNATYLSRIFSSDTGEKFSSFLNRTRIERAKKLLSLNNKIFQVAEQVGCGDNPQYFGQIFKKFTGETPSSYIESLKLQK